MTEFQTLCPKCKIRYNLPPGQVLRTTYQRNESGRLYCAHWYEPAENLPR